MELIHRHAAAVTINRNRVLVLLTSTLGDDAILLTFGCWCFIVLIAAVGSELFRSPIFVFQMSGYTSPFPCLTADKSQHYRVGSGRTVVSVPGDGGRGISVRLTVDDDAVTEHDR